MYTSFCAAAAPFGGSQRAALPAGTPSSMSLQHVPALPSAVLSVSRGQYTFKGDAHEGMASIPGARQPQLAPLNVEKRELN